MSVIDSTLHPTTVGVRPTFPLKKNCAEGKIVCVCVCEREREREGGDDNMRVRGKVKVA